MVTLSITADDATLISDALFVVEEGFSPSSPAYADRVARLNHEVREAAGLPVDERLRRIATREEA
jgi:hypothetical protein